MLTQTNLTSGSVTYYSWDYENRLTEAKEETSSGTVIYDEKYTYDVNGSRIGVSNEGTQELYMVYLGSNPYIDFSGTGTLTERSLFNPQALSVFYGQVSGSGTTEWFLTDNIDSIRQVVSTTGSVLDAITYDPYGNILSQTSTTYEPRFLYAGGAYDSNTGMYLDGAREDNPLDGRWLSEDRLGFGGGDLNLYRYVKNDPILVTDPSGMKVIGLKIVANAGNGPPVIIPIGAAVGGAVPAPINVAGALGGIVEGGTVGLGTGILGGLVVSGLNPAGGIVGGILGAGFGGWYGYHRGKHQPDFLSGAGAAAVPLTPIIGVFV